MAGKCVWCFQFQLHTIVVYVFDIGPPTISIV
jgi:hypothetical protein